MTVKQFFILLVRIIIIGPPVALMECTYKISHSLDKFTFWLARKLPDPYPDHDDADMSDV